MRVLRPVLVSIALAWSTAGCFFVDKSNETGPGGTGDPNQQVERDQRAQEDLRVDLEKNRIATLAQGNVDQVTTSGTRVLWLDTTNLTPVLRSYDKATKQALKYDFPFGDGDYGNFRASANFGATALIVGGEVVFQAYRLDSANDPIGSLTLPAPQDEQRWWAYAADGDDLYYFRNDGKAGELELFKWRVGSEAPERLFSLEDIGMEPGELWDFGVGDGQAIVVESGRIWSIDLVKRQATWLHNETEAYGASWDRNGILFSSADGPFFFSLATKSLLDVADAIERSDYQLNGTYTTAHYYNGDDSVDRRGNRVVYNGQMGVFAYDLATTQIRPLALEPIFEDKGYLYPLLLDENTLIVQQMDGADGPLMLVNIP